jgi:hypothetical protein
VSYAPDALLDARHYLQTKTGLPDNALGIVADQNHDGGYHCGWDRRRIRNGQLDDYSWEDAARDFNHKSNAAAALDIGNFDRLRELSIWLVQQCEMNRVDPNVNKDCASIRSIIYSPDGETVVRWDRLRIRSGGDSSHRTHTHISYFRDTEHVEKTAVFMRFFGDVVAERQDNTMFLQVEGDTAVYISDSRTYRHVKENDALQAALGVGYEIVVVRTVEQLRDLGGVEEGSQSIPVTLTDEQMNQLADKIAERSDAATNEQVRDAVADGFERGAGMRDDE